MADCKEKCFKTSIGGQALIEGVMMRGPEKTAMAVRNPEGEIVIEEVFDGEYKKNIRRTDSTINEDIINRPRIEKRYIFNNKCIFVQKKFNPKSLYTFFCFLVTQR